MSGEMEIEEQLLAMQAEWEIANRPRATALFSEEGTLFKLYTDGSVYQYMGNHWQKLPDDPKFQEEE